MLSPFANDIEPRIYSLESTRRVLPRFLGDDDRRLRRRLIAQFDEYTYCDYMYVVVMVSDYGVKTVK